MLKVSFHQNNFSSTFLALFAFKNAARKMKRAESVDRLKPSEPSQSLSRKSSFDSHLSRFLRGEISEGSIPDFCDTSMFKTIVRRARRTPQPNPLSASHISSHFRLSGI
uniref:Uncharacterized protein n=1 Tax=Ditylenchus dipsaci TaxID=166011 RepID=A0A915CY18_9BILA